MEFSGCDAGTNFLKLLIALYVYVHPEIDCTVCICTPRNLHRKKTKLFTELRFLIKNLIFLYINSYLGGRKYV